MRTWPACRRRRRLRWPARTAAATGSTPRRPARAAPRRRALRRWRPCAGSRVRTPAAPAVTVPRRAARSAAARAGAAGARTGRRAAPSLPRRRTVARRPASRLASARGRGRSARADRYRPGRPGDALGPGGGEDPGAAVDGVRSRGCWPWPLSFLLRQAQALRQTRSCCWTGFRYAAARRSIRSGLFLAWYGVPSVAVPRPFPWSAESPRLRRSNRAWPAGCRTALFMTDALVTLRSDLTESNSDIQLMKQGRRKQASGALQRVFPKRGSLGHGTLS
ncbi:hypothetical protein D9M68_678400 [compost metagenome]